MDIAEQGRQLLSLFEGIQDSLQNSIEVFKIPFRVRRHPI
jgi:hypothetical protein